MTSLFGCQAGRDDALGGFCFCDFRRRKRQPRAPRAFTLIELLVVIAIISLLVSILVPSLQKAKEIAKTAVCMSNLRNIGLGLAQYVSENNGCFPLNITDGQGDWEVAHRYPRWWPLIGKYVDDDWGDWDGSNWPKKSPNPAAGEGTVGHCPTHDEQPGSYSYKGNSTFFFERVTSATMTDRIIRPDYKLLVFELHTYCWIPWTDSRWWGGWLKYPFGVGGNPSVNTHTNVSNFLMCDLHVESVPYEDMMPIERWTLD